MDAAAHPTKPSTPPYGSPGTLQCISQSCRARRFDGRAAVINATLHAGGRVKKRPRLGVTRPTTALPFAASSLLAARRPPAAAAPHGRRARWACTMCTFANGAARKRCEMCGTERALRTAPFMVPAEPPAEPELLDDQCLVCNRSTQGTSEVLLCDGCDGEVHLRCAGLARVPEGDWLCAACAPETSEEESVPESAPSIPEHQLFEAPRPDVGDRVELVGGGEGVIVRVTRPGSWYDVRVGGVNGTGQTGEVIKVRRTHGEFRAFRSGAAATVAPPIIEREEEDQAEEALPAGFADAYRQFREMQERQFQAFLALVASHTQP